MPDSPRFLSRQPAPPLDAWIAYLWHWEDTAVAHGRERIMATAGVSLMVDLAACRLRHYSGIALNRPEHTRGPALCGPKLRPIAIDAWQPAMMGVEFRPGGAAALFGPVLEETCDLHVPLELLWGARAWELEERLLAAPHGPARLDVLEVMLRTAAIRQPVPDPDTVNLLERMDCAPGRMRLGKLAAELGLSQRRLIRRVTSATGVPPKRWLRLRRFEQVLDAVVDSPDPDWSDVAICHGFADQAHLTREFSEFAGITPGTWRHLRTSSPRHARLTVAGGDG